MFWNYEDYREEVNKKHEIILKPEIKIWK